ncbi:MAG: carboxypeptidase-like regulatory domain-containing protein [Flavobacteriaceae bacterium]|nr:carboxypeptidase-like regulatory domain-containing protein [Flavobacteriaceae bacterium]
MNLSSFHLKLIGFFIVLSSLCSSLIAQNKINIEGVVYDEFDYPIPYASIGIIKKNIGTSSTEEGTFKFYVSNNEISDVIEISSIGYEPFKITVQNFIALKDKTFVLKEKITALGEVSIERPNEIVKKAFKKLKTNTISRKHKLGVLYRRWSVEDKLCRYFIEQYIDLIDRGPSSYIQAFEVLQSRTSSDYRFIKNEQDRHALQFMALNNPLRNGPSLGSYNWKKIEDTFYEGEDVLVLQGTQKSGNSITLYIGFDSSKIYKIEKNTISMKIGKSLNALYIYKKNNEGKLYLSYHKRQWEGAVATPEHVKRAMFNEGKKERKYIPISYRHEVFVLDLEDGNGKMKLNDESIQQDMTLYKIPYDEEFWNSVSLPPETKFYLKNIKELEGLYDVPIETQFLYSNKR